MVDRVITDLAVIDVSARGLALAETAPGTDARDLQNATAAELLIPAPLTAGPPGEPPRATGARHERAPTPPERGPVAVPGAPHAPHGASSHGGITNDGCADH
ncbi:hypothetical protein ACFSL4_04780 [Streptomyces caeni]|uniref:Uncharacterized protein n=1 Tax=Streptomyces caeni TaxID=2307231 RepID=A0ABW4IJR6_9ACTN